MSDIYATPEAELGQQTTGQRAGGNVDDAIAGNIELRIFATLGEAWGQLKGFKLKCILALMIMFFVVFVAMAIAISIFATAFGLEFAADPVTGFALEIVIQVVFAAAMFPLMVGVMIMGLKHLTQNEVSVGEIFRHYGRTPAVILTYILQTILVTIGLILLILPGIYLMVAYVYAIPLVIEKRMGIWEALETSRKSITRVWFRMFGFMWLASLIIMLGFALLLIPLIWLMPWMVLANALIYLKLYGIEAETLSN